MKNIDNKHREILGIILILFSFLLLIGFYSSTDAFLLVIIRNLIKDGIGVGGYVLPFIVGFLGVVLISNKKISRLSKKFYSIMCFIVTVYFIISLATLDVYNRENYLSSIQAIINSNSFLHGGIFGLSIMRIMKSVLGFLGSLIVLISVNIISLILILDKSLYDIASITKKKVNSISPKIKFKKVDLKNKPNQPKKEENQIKNTITEDKKKKSNASIVKFLSKSLSIEEIPNDNQVEIKDNVKNDENNIQEKYNDSFDEELQNLNDENEINILGEEDFKSEPVSYEQKPMKEEFQYDDAKVDIDYLAESDDKISDEVSNELKMKGELLKRTLNNFKVKAEIKNVEKGPAVTRYEVEPDKGVKVSKILNLSDDIALAFATGGIRIEAPIPGKSLVGIEVPNDVVSMIRFKDILKSEEFSSSKKMKISIGLGKDISGKSIVADLAIMPHLLIAGATGSGKSVCINTILVSIVYKYLPNQVKLILIDPKVVELNVYNGIPHLLIPVVTDPKKASSALNWAITEMTNRYNKFAEKGVRNIDSYNELYDKKQIDEKIPYIVIVIDELADLMMVCHNEVEDAIARLAQMARAAGMHLIIATQRPSVDVITGVIKANIPSRISFSVSSSIDSRTILDQSGAEKLLGRGDMLFYPMGYLKPQRVQGAFISESEVEEFIKKIKEKFGSSIEYNEEIIEHINNDGYKVEENVSGDELIDKAIEVILKNNNATTSILQRKLKIGYNRAASIIEELENRGIIGFRGSSTKREILIDEKDIF